MIAGVYALLRGATGGHEKERKEGRKEGREEGKYMCLATSDLYKEIVWSIVGATGTAAETRGAHISSLTWLAIEKRVCVCVCVCVFMCVCVIKPTSACVCDCHTCSTVQLQALYLLLIRGTMNGKLNSTRGCLTSHGSDSHTHCSNTMH